MIHLSIIHPAHHLPVCPSVPVSTHLPISAYHHPSFTSLSPSYLSLTCQSEPQAGSLGMTSMLPNPHLSLLSVSLTGGKVALRGETACTGGPACPEKAAANFARGVLALLS